MASLCFGCFREINGEGQCPHCGYDPKADEGKFGAAIKSGEILNERYIVGRVMGQGGFGVTYAALDFATQQRVAIKEFFPTALVSRELSGTVSAYSVEMEAHFTQGKSGFLEEAHTLEKLKDSEHIVNVLNFFEENGTAYFVMDYVQGQNLKAYVKIMGGRLGQEAANRILIPIMEAMEDVHAKGIVHRDIAPDNIIVTAEGSATLIDFGAARYSTGEKSMSLDVVLKHGYAPKEQYSRRSRQGPYTDIYAMAATYYYSVTGKVPPDAIDRTGTDELQPPSALGAKLSPEAEAAVLKALSVEPENRFQTMGDFIKALRGEKLPEKKKENKKKPPNKPKGKGLAIIVPVLLLAAVFAVTGLLPGEKSISLPEPAATQAPAAITPTAEAPAPEPEEEPEAENTPETGNVPEVSLIFEPTLLYDAGGITVTATDYIPNGSTASLVMSVRNTTGKNLSLMGEYFVANDCLSLGNSSLFGDITAGEQEVSAYINLDEIREAGISQLSTLEIKLSVYDPATYENDMGEPVVVNISNAPIETGNLDDRGVLLYDDRGIKLVYKGISNGNLVFYIENMNENNVELLHKDASVDGELITREDVLYMFGICRTGTQMCSDMYLSKEDERLSISEDSRVVLTLMLYLNSDDGDFIDRIELKDVEIP